MVKKKGTKRKPLDPQSLGIVLILFGFLTLVSLVSFSFLTPEKNWLGILGYVAALGIEYLFGLAAYLIPLYSIWLGVRLIRKEKISLDPLYFFLFLISSSFLLTVFAETLPKLALFFEKRVISETLFVSYPYPRTLTRYNLGGVPFYFLFSDLPFVNLKQILSPTGALLIFSSLNIASFFLLTKLELLSTLQKIKSVFKKREKKEAKYAGLKIEPILEKKSLKEILPKVTIPKKEEKGALPKKETPIKPMALPKNLMPVSLGAFQLPSYELLSFPKEKVDSPTLKKDLLRQASILEETLKSFGIDAKVGEIHSGPTITSFEVHPSIGVKVQKIKALENDIALNMQAKSIRIVAPIPGKAAVGVEVPALHPQEVSFREMLQYYFDKGKKLQIPILLGKAISGDFVFADLAKCPHLLIAGATGSGKSVCINTLVMSLLMTAKPNELKLLMVDPKKVELTQYSNLPHMIAPVITEPHGAYAALQWLVKEMQVRYEILKQLGLRNIHAFNHRKVNKELEGALQIPIPETMPYIVAIIDEFADLMMVSSSDIETPIARIAQMARAVGIHLILATQRPSREVITGIIKANIPTRISFKVASRINSQIILDDTGAESLLGNGDLLFLPPATSQLLRAQGAYIRDDDILKVIEYLTKQLPTEYLIPSFDSFRNLDLNGGSESAEGKDTLYDQALSIVLASKTASTTYLQRKLKIGYARAAGLMDELEQNGIIGPQEGAKPRRVIAARQDASLESEDGEEFS